MASNIEALSSSLIREFLSRKGLKGTLAKLDEELPRTADSISNRITLAKTVKIDRLMKQNKELSTPYRTMLEVIVRFLIDTHPKKYSTTKVHTVDSKPITSGSSPPSNLLQDQTSRSSSMDLLMSYQTEQTGTTSVDAGTFGKIGASIDAGRHGKTGMTSIDIGGMKSVDTGGKSGATMSLDTGGKHMMSLDTGGKRSVDTGGKRMMSVDTGGRGNTARGRPLSSAKVKTLSDQQDAIAHMLTEDTIDQENTKYDTEPSFISAQSKESESESSEDNQNPAYFASRDSKYGSLMYTGQDILPEGPDLSLGQGSVSSTLNPKRVPTKDNTLLCEDLEDLDLDIDVPTSAEKSASRHRAGLSGGFPQGKPIGTDEAKALRQILFGVPSKCFNAEWKRQALTFSDRKGLRYGLIQNKGGPCGVLASLQAHIMKHLLFTDSNPQDVSRNLRPTIEARNKALISSIAEILWRAGGRKSATVVTTSSRGGRGRISKVTHKPCDLIDELDSTIFSDEEMMRSFLEANLNQFSDESLFGCITFTISVILSRGIAQVRSDMDEPTSQLIGAHDYCTQELVNLILTGKAVSNVFDGVVDLGSGKDKKILKGIDQRSDIGFLSLFEHYGSCQVGKHYKTPHYPVFVVCSESHFLVVFSTVKMLMKQKELQSCFDLYYYDGLANQSEPIRLTIRTGGDDCAEIDDELVPPIELCIRTRWNNSLIDWNGTEQLL